MKLCKSLGVSTSIVVSTYFKKFLNDWFLTIGYDDTEVRYYDHPGFVSVNEKAETV